MVSGTSLEEINEEVGQRNKPRAEEEANPIPFLKDCQPPLWVTTKLSVDADRVRTVAKTGEEVNHAAKRRSARADHFTSRVEMANQGLELLAMTSAPAHPGTDNKSVRSAWLQQK